MQNRALHETIAPQLGSGRQRTLPVKITAHAVVHAIARKSLNSATNGEQARVVAQRPLLLGKTRGQATIVGVHARDQGRARQLQAAVERVYNAVARVSDQ